jgi:uncharacterized peroxidase-related enzyme
MPHIALEQGVPGIVSAFAFRPETATPMRELAETLLRGPSSLSSADRETIAAYVSSRNECRFCQLSHSAAAAEHLGGSDAHYALIESVKADLDSASVTPKLRSLLRIAGKVQQGGKQVTSADIAAAFCMYNRYVDGLATWQPDDPNSYRPMGKRMAHEGYVRK